MLRAPTYAGVAFELSCFIQPGMYISVLFAAVLRFEHAQTTICRTVAKPCPVVLREIRVQQRQLYALQPLTVALVVRQPPTKLLPNVCLCVLCPGLRRSTLHDLAFAEATLLHGFRVDSINSGETEWVPYVSQAQALVNAQLARFSSLPAAEAACAQRLPASQWLSVADRRVGRGSEQELRLERRRAKVGDTGGSGAKSADSGSDGVARVSDRENARGGAGDEHDNDEGGEADKEQSDGASGGGAGAPGAGGGRGAGVEGGNYFRFFQSCDGQKAFLHPLDMRQLLDDAEKGMPLPQRIDAPVRCLLCWCYCVRVSLCEIRDCYGPGANVPIGMWRALVVGYDCRFEEDDRVRGGPSTCLFVCLFVSFCW